MGFPVLVQRISVLQTCPGGYFEFKIPCGFYFNQKPMKYIFLLVSSPDTGMDVNAFFGLKTNFDNKKVNLANYLQTKFLKKSGLSL